MAVTYGYTRVSTADQNEARQIDAMTLGPGLTGVWHHYLSCWLKKRLDVGREDLDESVDAAAQGKPGKVKC